MPAGSYFSGSGLFSSCTGSEDTFVVKLPRDKPLVDDMRPVSPVETSYELKSM